MEDNDLDEVLKEILSEILEAFCGDCNRVLATGTPACHDMVSNVACDHAEVWDHETWVRTWADEPEIAPEDDDPDEFV